MDGSKVARQEAGRRRAGSAHRRGLPSVGVAGVGALGRHHARVVRDLDGVACAGVFDTDGDRGRAVGDELDIRVMSSLADLLEVSDAVVVAVPTTSHEAVAIEAIRAGVHVFVEKPMAPGLAAADRMIAEAARRGVVLQVGHVERFNPALVAARPYLDRPLFVESHRLAPFTPRSLDVAVVLDLMIHDVDLLCSLVGRPVTEMAAAGVPVLTRHVDIANARLAFEGGAVANLTASRVSVNRVRKLRVWQRSGYLSLDLAAGRGEFYRLREGVSVLDGPGLPAGVPSLAGLASVVERIPVTGDGTEPLVAEVASFRDAIAGLAPPPVTGEDGRRALELSLAIEQQIEDHVTHTRSASA
ncbi:MAG: Gfo/Idh/MocA family oxidoreductase [Gemmatimonadota bacterium]|nr:Gfo/Idh/MocA family oxidoreductase [Gemmatimonadota bacterium]